MPTLKENCKLHYIISLFCVTGCLSRSYKHRPYPKKDTFIHKDHGRKNTFKDLSLF